MDIQFYLIDENDNLRFTREGRAHLAPLFELAGIDVASIRTKAEYLHARKQASPYFLQHLANRADTWPDTDQYRFLNIAIFGNDLDLQRELYRFEMKKGLKLIK